MSKKVILITGASSGIGESLANHLTQKGHIVYGVSRNIGSDKQFFTIQMDVTDERDIENVLSKIITEQGRIDILINNAGVALLGPIEFAQTNQIISCFNTNFIGTANTIKAVLPYMREQNNGLIINIGSLAAANGLPYRGYYSAAKAAVEKITEALRLELAPWNIQACCVEPGDFRDTNIHGNSIVANTGDEVYKWENTRTLIDQLIKRGKLPEQLALLIERIIDSKKVKSRYRIGKLSERLSASLKNIIPDWMMEKMIKMYFKL